MFTSIPDIGWIIIGFALLVLGMYIQFARTEIFCKKEVWSPIISMAGGGQVDVRQLARVSAVYPSGTNFVYNYWLTGNSTKFSHMEESEELLEAFRRDIIKAWKERT